METLTTQELFTRRALGAGRDEDAIAWALGQLADAPPLPSLATLASLSGLLNHFEVEDLLRRALSELGLHEPAAEETYRSFLESTARAVLDGAVTPRAGCATLAAAHGGDLGRRELQPFWLLSLGRRDLESDGHQFYYAGLSLSSFEQCVRDEARHLLAQLDEGRHAG